MLFRQTGLRSSGEQSTQITTYFICFVRGEIGIRIIININTKTHAVRYYIYYYIMFGR